LKYHEGYRHFKAKLLELVDSVDAVVFTGDLYHNKLQLSSESVQLASEFLKEVADRKPFYLIAGNHDLNLNNSSRLDSVSPVVEALNHPNIHYLKFSGEYKTPSEACIFNVKSILDPERWVSPSDSSKVNIALFHGGIESIETDSGFSLKGGEPLSIFEGCDFGFLGDIHKTFQSVDKSGRFIYAGSAIQQNFSETNDKGVLIWDIQGKDKFSVKHVEIPALYPFVTVELTPSGRLPKNLQISEGSRIRIVSQKDIPLDLFHQVIELIRFKFKPESVVFLNKGKKQIINYLGQDVEEENLRDTSIQEKHIREHLKEYELKEEDFLEIFELNRKFNHQLNLDEEIERGISWSLEEHIWNNLYNYGGDNRIDFSNLSGIVGILGANKTGKSSLIESFVYTIYNSSSKNNKKVLNIINQNKENASGQISIRIGSSIYKIERNSEKYKKVLKGVESTEAKTSVNFQRISDSGVITDLNGEDRKETDKNIRRLFGTLEDFLLTSFSSQHGALSYIEEGSTKRKEILAKFLDLGLFEQKFLLAKEEAGILRSNLRRVENKNYSEEIDRIRLLKEEKEEESERLENKRTEQKNAVDSLREQATEIRTRLSSFKNIDLIDEELMLRNKENFARELSIVRESLAEKNKELQKKKTLFSKIEQFLAEFKLERHKDIQNQSNEILKEIKSIEKNIKILELDEENKRTKSNLLKEVPCGTLFSSCKFIKDAHIAKQQMPEIGKRIQEETDKKEELLRRIAGLNLEETERILGKYEELLSRKNQTQSQIVDFLSEVNVLQTKKTKLQNEIKENRRLLDLFEKRKEEQHLIKSLNSELSNVQKEYVEEEKIYQNIDNSFRVCVGRIGSLEQELNSIVAEEEETRRLRKQYFYYEMFMRCMHTNGISYEIIKRKLPLINSEIAKILMNVVDFEIFFVDDDDRLEIYIKHPSFDPRLIEMGSGAEKTLAAFAIRLALIKVSSLPKPDIFILDEPATDLDEENMDGFIRGLELLKNTFRVVFLISHLEVLKDNVDMIVPIEKINSYARVQI
jgi:DNA repair exonuclease SbcCD nuclease subunit/ABC-type molybdenum transport system ATPase subunit/photorepair protein PhrA